MTREEQIIEIAKEYYNPKSGVPYSLQMRTGFIEGAKWADANPDKNLVYTKQELIDMGFAFDLNGSIVTPEKENDSLERFIKYKEDKLIEKVCNWIKDRVTIPYEGKTDESGVPIASDYIEHCTKRIAKAEEICKDFIKAMEKNDETLEDHN